MANDADSYRISSLRNRYADHRPSLTARARALGEVPLVRRPPSPFLTLKFWRGMLFIGTLNIGAFLVLANTDMSWLVHTLPPKHGSTTGPIFAWPKGMVPLTIGYDADGQPIYTVPTRTLTPDEMKTLEKIWNSQEQRKPIETSATQAQPGKTTANSR